MITTQNNLERLLRVIKITKAIRAKRPSEMNFAEIKKYAQYNRVIHNLSASIN
jgi:hypothetical protein